MELLYGNLTDYMSVCKSMFFNNECLIEHWKDSKFVGSNYIPKEFSGPELEEARLRIETLARLVPRRF